MSGSLRRIFQGSPARRSADSVYRTIIARARDAAFYEHHGVPDTLDGRFEMIVLHAFLVLHRLRSDVSAGRFGQALFDLMFADMDQSLREMGTGDLSVGKQVKRMATAFYGRISAYQAALADQSLLDAALRRNLFGTVSDVDATHVIWFATYLETQAQFLSSMSAGQITRGDVRFAPLP